MRTTGHILLTLAALAAVLSVPAAIIDANAYAAETAAAEQLGRSAPPPRDAFGTCWLLAGWLAVIGLLCRLVAVAESNRRRPELESAHVLRAPLADRID